MAKEALYFSHDSNASNDPKLIAMRSVYGTEGYGRYWLLIEMLREADSFKLDMRSKYAFHAYAEHLKCDCNAFASFLHDCIDEFQLFSSDGDYFWSESLLRRMKLKEEKSEKARQSAEARWKNSGRNANASEKDTDAPKIDAIKESKLNKKEFYIAQFEMFWELYPNKKGKSAALKKWLTYGDSIDIERVLEGTREYIRFCKSKDRPYKDGSTFVNQKSWEDDWALPNNVTPHPALNGRQAQRDPIEHRMFLQQEAERRDEYSHPANL